MFKESEHNDSVFQIEISEIYNLILLKKDLY